MSKDDPLNDLEDFIDSDWKEVVKKFQDEEYKKEISEPVIPNFPSYGEFYQTLVELVTKENIPPRLGYMIHRIIAHQDRKVSESFDKLWSLFCDPLRFVRIGTRCPTCDHPQEIVYSKEPIQAFRRNWEEMSSHAHITQETVHCIKCGSGFYYVAGNLIGVFDNRRIE